VYERPGSHFVASFVGTSNVLADDAAQQVLGRTGSFSIRPEKIRLSEPDAPVAAGEHFADGVVTEVEYVGSITRFLVNLDVGGHLVALQQNLTTTSTDVARFRNRRVRLVWDSDHEFELA
jgi:putative spermidine/putrescine transport system ATP-binding protein